jgi:hypothetical protein
MIETKMNYRGKWKNLGENFVKLWSNLYLRRFNFAISFEFCKNHSLNQLQ